MKGWRPMRILVRPLAAAFMLAGGVLAAPHAAAATGHAFGHFKRACAAPTTPDTAACHAIVVDALSSSLVQNDRGGSSAPSGYGPADLRSAYNLPSTSAGSGQTV